jgi:hypothetical protein
LSGELVVRTEEFSSWVEDWEGGERMGMEMRKRIRIRNCERGGACGTGPDDGPWDAMRHDSI